MPAFRFSARTATKLNVPTGCVSGSEGVLQPRSLTGLEERGVPGVFPKQLCSTKPDEPCLYETYCSIVLMPIMTPRSKAKSRVTSSS